MIQASDAITFSVSRTILRDIARLSDELTEKMHGLLERNTNGELDAAEKEELDTLVRMGAIRADHFRWRCNRRRVNREPFLNSQGPSPKNFTRDAASWCRYCRLT